MTYVGGYHEYRGGYSPVGDTILCNLSTVGEYHDTCGQDIIRSKIANSK